MTPRNIRTTTDYHALAETRGGKWAGNSLPLDTHTKTLWKCKEGHQWEAQFKNIAAGRWCPTCAKVNKVQTNKRKTPADYHAAAARSGFIWLGPEVENAATKTEWQCSEGHRWWATYMGVGNVGSGCPYCAGVIPLSPAEFQSIAAGHGIEWLGPAVSYREKTRWRCRYGHDWEAQYGNMRKSRGSGCPKCAKRIERNL